MVHDPVALLNKVTTNTIHFSVQCSPQSRHKWYRHVNFVITQHLLSSKFGSFRKWESCRLGRKVVAKYIAPYLQTENETFKQNQSFQRWQHESGKNGEF